MPPAGGTSPLPRQVLLADKASCGEDVPSRGKVTAIKVPTHNPVQTLLGALLPLIGLLLLCSPAWAAELQATTEMVQSVTNGTDEPALLDKVLGLFLEAPYIWIPVLMIAAGLGFPLPEEIILVFTGYLAATNPESHSVYLLGLLCIASILVGDLVPFLLGRIFGPKILKIRLVRTWMHTERLARLNAFFEKNGRLTILLARFITGVRTPAFFTAGTMRMSIFRFLIMDGIGAVIGSAVFIWLGAISSGQIDAVIDWIHKTEQGLFILIGVGTVGLVGYLWWRHRRRQRLLGEEVRETFVQPSHAMDSSDREGQEEPEASAQQERREIPVLTERDEVRVSTDPGDDQEPEAHELAAPEAPDREPRTSSQTDAEEDRIGRDKETEGWILPSERKNGEGG